MTTRIVVLNEPLEPDISSPPQDRLIAGSPRHSVWNHFTDPTQQFFAGRWSSTAGSWRVRYTENELCVITEGNVVIRSDSGVVYTFGAGDAFVIPAGFSGTWEVQSHCTKIYAIFEPRT